MEENNQQSPFASLPEGLRHNAKQQFKQIEVATARFPQPAFPPLEFEARTTITTEAAAYYLNRKPQTLRAWACLEKGPIRPVRINGRLAWPVAELKRLQTGEGA